MSKPKKDYPSSKLKPWHIFLMSCLLTSLMILNSNYIYEKRAMKTPNEKTNNLLDESVSLRNLQEPNDNVNHENSDEVCSRGSDSLIEYYKTGDLSKIDLDEEEIECEDKDKDYMQALIALVKKILEMIKMKEEKKSN